MPAGWSPQLRAQPVPGDDQADERQLDRVEHLGQGDAEVADDRTVPGPVPQVFAVAQQAGDAVADEFGQERVEVSEVPVQDTLGHAQLGGDGPAGQRARPVPEQDPLGGTEELLAGVAQGKPGRHRWLSFALANLAPHSGRMVTLPSRHTASDFRPGAAGGWRSGRFTPCATPAEGRRPVNRRAAFGRSLPGSWPSRPRTVPNGWVPENACAGWSSRWLTRSVVTESVLVSCLSRYWGLAGARVGVHNGGMGSGTWFVDLGDRRWVAKAVAPDDGRPFAGGMVIARRLEQAGIPAGAPVPAVSGELVVNVGGAWLALLTWVPGRALTGQDDAGRI